MKMILIHGALGSGKQFSELEALLKADGLDVECPNLPWHADGETIDDPYTLPSLAIWFLEKYNNHFPVSIFGHSMGGYLGLYLMQHHPEKIHSLTTLGTRIPWNELVASKENNMLNPALMEAKVPSFYHSLKSIHPHCDILLTKTQTLLSDLGLFNYLNNEALSLLNGKVQLLCGDRDTMAGITETLEASMQIPNCSLGILPNTPHPFQKSDIHVLRLLLLNNMK